MQRIVSQMTATITTVSVPDAPIDNDPGHYLVATWMNDTRLEQIITWASREKARYSRLLSALRVPVLDPLFDDIDVEALRALFLELCMHHATLKSLIQILVDAEAMPLAEELQLFDVFPRPAPSLPPLPWRQLPAPQSAEASEKRRWFLEPSTDTVSGEQTYSVRTMPVAETQQSAVPSRAETRRRKHGSAEEEDEVDSATLIADMEERAGLRSRANSTTRVRGVVPTPFSNMTRRASRARTLPAAPSVPSSQQSSQLPVAVKPKKAEAVVKSDDNAAADDLTVCVVCMDNPRTMTFVPCGHYCVCAACAKTLEAKKVCPMCRATAQMIMQTFK